MLNLILFLLRLSDCFPLLRDIFYIMYFNADWILAFILYNIDNLAQNCCIEYPYQLYTIKNEGGFMPKSRSEKRP